MEVSTPAMPARCLICERAVLVAVESPPDAPFVWDVPAAPIAGPARFREHSCCVVFVQVGGNAEGEAFEPIARPPFDWK